VQYRLAPPLLGQHTEEVLRDVLGKPPEAIAAYAARLRESVAKQ